MTALTFAMTVAACTVDGSGLAPIGGGTPDGAEQLPPDGEGGDGSGAGSGLGGDQDPSRPGHGEVPHSGDARCTGKPGKPGLTTRQVAGHNVQLYIPPSVDANQPVPLLLVHHGLLMNGQAMKDTTGFTAIADREGFAVAFPDGLSGGLFNAPTWNAGSNLCNGTNLATGTADDVSFVRELVASIQEDQCISRDHVFATGLSIGAFFSHHLGCQAGDLIRGIAPHSGGTYPGDCPSTGPLPVMIWHGTIDPTVFASCGADARDRWVERNGCASTFDSVDIQGGRCEWHHGCPKGGQVVYCTVSAGHQWSGGSGLIGATGTENASELIWKFFKEQTGL